MGCLIQLFTELLGYFLWYFVLYPLLIMFTFLKKIGLIWSIGFYVLSEFLFLDTFIQDYRILITILLLIPFVVQIIRGLIWSLDRFSLWQQNYAYKKVMKLKQKEREVNHFYD
jgi:hypothetical protein